MCADGSCFIRRKNVLPAPETLFTGPSSHPSQSQSHPSPQHRVVAPPKKLMKLVGQAVKDFDMIREGDRLLLGLSGGKDSLSLLHTLIALQVGLASSCVCVCVCTITM